MDQPTAQIDAWAIVEIMGHTRIAGRTKTEAFGPTVMLRVDVPELPEKRRQEERSWDCETGRYYGSPKLVEIVHPSEPAYTRYFGLQAVFSITPCDEATAMAYLDRLRKSPPSILRLTASLPDQTAEAAVAATGQNDDEQDEHEFEGDESDFEN